MRVGMRWGERINGRERRCVRADDRRLHLKKWGSQEISVHRGTVLLTRLLPLDPCRRAFAVDSLTGVCSHPKAIKLALAML